MVLDRKLSEKRIFPAIDINKSGTRREELLLSQNEWEAVMSIRRSMSRQDNMDIAENLLNLLITTRDNDEFVEKIKKTMK